MTFPVLTQNASAFNLTGNAIPPGSMATTTTEQAVVGFDGALYLEHPEAGQGVDVPGVCKAVLPSPLPSAELVSLLICQ